MIELLGFGFRHLELGLILLALILCLLSFVKSRRPGFVWVSALAMVVMFAHLVLEQGRWQMIPLYGFVFWYSIWIAIPSRRQLRVVALVVRIVLVVFVLVPALLLPVAFPLFKVPEPTGPNPVGLTSLVVGEIGIVNLHYPATTTGSGSTFRGSPWRPGSMVSRPDRQRFLAPYWSAAEVAAFSLPGFPSFMTSHLSLTPRNSILRGELIEGKLPVAVFVPSPDALPSDYVVFSEQLASLGWLVADLPPGRSDLALVLLSAAESGFGDGAFTGVVDTNRAVIVGLGWNPIVGAGLPSISIGGDTLVSVVTSGASYGFELDGLRLADLAESNRHLLVRPSRLLLGSSDLPPAGLNEACVRIVSALLGGGEFADPVFSGVPGATALADTREAIVDLVPDLVIRPFSN